MMTYAPAKMASDSVPDYVRLKVIRSFERKFGHSTMPYSIRWTRLADGTMVVDILDTECLACARYDVNSSRIRCLGMTEALAR